MSIESQNELQSFHQFFSEQLNSGVPYSSPEEVLEAWRLQNRSPEEFEADVAAIREALAEMEAGDQGTPLEEYLVNFSKRHDLDNDA